MSYELMQNKDVRAELDINADKAKKFMMQYGGRMGNLFYIPRKRFRQLQLDGTVAEFMRRLKDEVRADRRSD